MDVHEYMKQPDRAIYGRLDITYSTPLKSSEIRVTTPSDPYNSRKDQLMDMVSNASFKHFTTFDNVLDGTFLVSDNATQVGWWPEVPSDANGNYNPALEIVFDFSSRPLEDLFLAGDDIRNVFPVDFVVTIERENDTPWVQTVTGNTSVLYTFVGMKISDAVRLTLSVTKINKPNMPFIFLEVSIGDTLVYESDALMNISLLEELSYTDTNQVLGGVSANEINATLDNSLGQFYFNNPDSQVANQLKKNRKVVGWLGWMNDGSIEWYRLGTFWTYTWDVPKGRLTASVTAFDTIGLLDTTRFFDHQVYQDFSLGALIALVIADAQTVVAGLEYEIDQSLYNIIIPYAWFEKGSHTKALRRIASSYPVDIYCNRDGIIIAKDRNQPLTIVDTWSESTNIMTTEYPTLYAAATNTVEVPVYDITVENKQVLNITKSFIVQANSTMDFTFSDPMVGSLVMNMDTTLAYTYEAYSWGIRVVFSEAGFVTSLTATADVLEIDNETIVVRNQLQSAVEVDGILIEVIDGPFIQSTERASEIAQQFLDDAIIDKFDADIKYRGDMALSITDGIYLQEGIAPTNNYVIRSHQLYWNGGLDGKATMITKGA